MVSQIVISIHALRVEGDRGRRVSDPACRYFYPRPPGGGRPTCHIITSPLNNFYPRPPGGGRLSIISSIFPSLSAFLSTPSGWRATCFALRPDKLTL